jgi:hypothetical protein
MEETRSHDASIEHLAVIFRRLNGLSSDFFIAGRRLFSGGPNMKKPALGGL